MHILVLGAAGMVGTKFLARVAGDGHIGGRQVTKRSEERRVGKEC